MQQINEKKTAGYIVLLNDETRYFETEKDAQKYFKQCKIRSLKPIMQLIEINITTTITKRIIGF